MNFQDSFNKFVYWMIKRPVVKGVTAAILPHRFWLIWIIHLMLFTVSFLLTFWLLRQKIISLEMNPREMFLRTLGPLLLFRTLLFQYHDLHQGLWRYVSYPDLLNIARSVVISSLLFSVLGIIVEPFRVPEQVIILDMILCIFLTGGARFTVRHFREQYYPQRARGDVADIMLVGPISRVQPLVKEMLDDPKSRYHPVALIDPTLPSRSRTIRVNDLPVFPAERVLQKGNRLLPVKEIVISWPNASRKQLDQVVEMLRPLEAAFKMLPLFHEILSGQVSISDIRPVEIEDLLDRAPVEIDLNAIRAYLEGKYIAVTGGGGSIGSELCRQVAGFSPKAIIIVERSENTLYDLQLELNHLFPNLPIHASISSVNDGEGLKAMFQDMKVDVVFHAAAYKHVPLMEVAPVESAYNNILGTYNVVQAARAAGVKRFVMVSTDKAVNPANVMGVTKRIAEMIVQGQGRKNCTRFMTVRFGNVLGSAGSVIPIFKKQIAEGRPITVTHPDIERFFMTIPEAVQLILQAGCMGNGGEIFVLDMGEPVKILKLAERLITLSGKKPYEDVEIQFTGIRPGEKMYEELFNVKERNVETSHPRILVALSDAVDPEEIESQVQRIRKMIRSRDEKALSHIFRQLVPGYIQEPVETATTLGKITEGTRDGSFPVNHQLPDEALSD